MYKERSPVAQYFYNIYEAVYTTLVGLKLTIKTSFTKPVTVKYPEVDIKTAEQPKDALLSYKIADNFKGVLFNDVYKCTACGLCAQICPIDTIFIESKKIPEGKGMILFRYEIDEARCMHCGLCVEVCPVNSLVFTTEFAFIKEDTDNMVEVFVDKPTNEKLIQIAIDKKKAADEKAAKAKAAREAAAAKKAAEEQKGSNQENEPVKDEEKK